MDIVPESAVSALGTASESPQVLRSQQHLSIGNQKARIHRLDSDLESRPKWQIRFAHFRTIMTQLPFDV